MGKKKAQAHHTATYFHTRHVSIQLNCIRNPAGLLACPSVPEIARAVLTSGPRYYSGSASCVDTWCIVIFIIYILSIYFRSPGDPGKEISSSIHFLSFVYNFLSICETKTWC